MITPKLEELILKGRAFFKTFVAGGGQKNTLNIPEDRFIIITDLTYYPMFVKTGTPSRDNNNTQVSIYGDRGFNHYVFRNFVSHDSNKYQTPGVICVNTYLMHTEAVGFSFSNAQNLQAFAGPAPEFNPGYAPPLEYGKTGLPGVLPVTITADADPTGLGTYFNKYVTRPSGGYESNQLQFPVDGTLGMTAAGIQSSNTDYPLMLVNYVEILGLPNNLGI